MPTAEQLRTRLLKKLKELFQLDQPDLDFGFYRIMHAKAAQVSQFIEKDLLKIVEDAFGQVDQAHKETLKAKIDEATATARKFGAPDPEQTEGVKEAKARYLAIADNASAEADIYDHLYRFFERYYDDGDFISRRYYARETEGRAAPFAVPYNGEEVKLHWANADQYYIKTAEYFTNFTFDLSHAAKVQMEKNRKEKSGDKSELFGMAEKDVPDGLKVHFCVVEATEGEHGNVRATDVTKRYFIIHKEKPVEVNGAGDLTINFEYRPDPEKTGQEGTWREKRNSEAVSIIFDFGLKMLDLSNDELATQFGPQIINHQSKIEKYFRLLKVPAPTENDKKRPLLAKYINQYTAKNTMDYFIHKDLGGFLRRELDFYIKNEVMRLDDIENADVPAVETYLAKIKVLRKISGKLIDFLAQLENFQKKLWLKKKFVVETNYCITLDRVPEELYPEIAANVAQHDEWVKLFAIDEIKGNLASPGYSRPLTVEFLKANDKLVLDTGFFDDGFKARLMTKIEDLDEELDGVLINSENLQAALFLRNRYRATVDGVYLDPPYNTDASEIIYKNGYKNSSWASLMFDRLALIRDLQSEGGCICVTIDDFEKHIVKNQLDTLYGIDNDLSTVAIRSNPQGRSTVQGFSVNHEYGLFYRMSEKHRSVGRLSRSQDQIERYNETDEDGKPFLWENFRKTGTDSAREDRVKQHYPIVIKGNNYRIPEMSWNEVEKQWVIQEEIDLQIERIIYPIDEDQNERVWKWGHDRVRLFPNHIKVVVDENGDVQIYRRNYLTTEGALPGTWWDKGKYGAGSHGTNLLTAMFGKGHVFSFPKSVYAVEDCIRVITNSNRTAIVADLFGGSGTTAHATVNLNRADKGTRKYLLVEIGPYFDEIVIPRIKKAVFSPIWDAGKPKDRNSYFGLLKKRSKEAQKDLDALMGFTDKAAYEFERQLLLSEINRLRAEIESVGTLGQQSNSAFLGWSHAFKYLRLESYEDTLNNLRFDENPMRAKTINANASLKEDYMLRYLLDVETRGSQSLLNIDAFRDPTAYMLKVKKPGSDEYVTRPVDLLETFNYLIGLRVVHIAEPQVFNAAFTRIPDPELPEDQHTKLVLDGKLQQIKNPQSKIENPHWWFRKVEGWVPKDRQNPNNGQKEKVLIVWRKLTDDLEKDNLMLDEWFEKNRISTRDFEFDTIYVNGSNNLPNLQKEGDTWKVRLIEEEFMKRMWEAEGV